MIGETAKRVVDELIVRNFRSLARVVKIALRWRQFYTRVSHARSVTASDCFAGVSLEDEGYFFIRPGPELLTADLVDACRDRMNHSTKFRPNASKSYQSNLLAVEDYDRQSAFVQFALQEKLLNSVSRYLRCAASLQAIELVFTPPSRDAPRQTQLWHLDKTDRKLIKVFVLVHDTALEHGPLIFLPRDRSRKVRPFFQHYLPDEAIGNDRLEHQITMTGPAGSALLIDTSKLYHCGGRCEKPRLIYIVEYSSGFGYSARQRKLVNGVSLSAGFDLPPVKRLAIEPHRW